MLTLATDCNQFSRVSVGEKPGGSMGCCNIAPVVMLCEAHKATLLTQHGLSKDLNHASPC